MTEDEDGYKLLQRLIKKHGGEIIKVEDDKVKAHFQSLEASAKFCKELHKLQGVTYH